MSTQILKKLTVFIIVMMFSVHVLHAQCAGNKVKLYKQGRTTCRSACVAPSQVQKYLADGWSYACRTYFYAAGKKKSNIILIKKSLRPRRETT